MKSYLLSLLILLAGELTLAKQVLVAGLRQNKKETRDYSESHGLPLLQSSAVEFSNGNTFVRLQQNVSFAKVDLVMPVEMDSEALMEALITIFTLKKNGASVVRVIISSDKPVVYLRDLKLRLTIETWLKVAGADLIVSNGKERLVRNKRIEKARLPPKEVVILGFNHESLAEQLGNQLGYPVITKPDHESIQGKGVLLVSPAPIPVNANFFRTLLVAAQLKSSGAAYVELLTPYLPYARSDKVDQPGVAVNGKLIANLIESAGVNAVSFVRSHAPQSEGFFNVPTRNISGRKTINAFLQNENVDTIVSPDAGFQKDATLYATELHLGVAVINKVRDPLTGKTTIVGISGSDIKGKTLAIIDDETASGGTLGKAAEYLKELGAARILAVVTHLTGDAIGALDSPAIDRLVVTDTQPIAVQHPKLTVLPIAAELAQEIFSIQLQEPNRSCRPAFN